LTCTTHRHVSKIIKVDDLKRIFLNLGLAAVFLTSRSALAQGPIFTLPVLSQDQSNTVIKTLAGALIYRPVEGASEISNVGFSIGASMRAASISGIGPLISDSLKYVPAGEIVLAVQLPGGVAFEGGFLPGLSILGATLTNLGGDIKWNLTHSLLENWPLNLSLRFLAATSHLNYSQMTGGTPMDVDYVGGFQGGYLTVSKTFLFFEPYLSWGAVSQFGTLTGSGQSSLFLGIVATNSSESFQSVDSWFQAGVQFKISIVTLSGEYDRIFGSESYCGKLAFKF
jgi:hypothetical protein